MQVSLHGLFDGHPVPRHSMKLSAPIPSASILSREAAAANGQICPTSIRKVFGLQMKEESGRERLRSPNRSGTT